MIKATAWLAAVIYARPAAARDYFAVYCRILPSLICPCVMSVGLPLEQAKPCLECWCDHPFQAPLQSTNLTGE